MVYRRNRAAAGLLAAAALGLAACGGGQSGDGPAFGGAVPVTAGPESPVPTHPAVPTTVVGLRNVEYPQVAKTAKARVINAALMSDAESLLSRQVACAVSTLRADSAVLSFRWTCAGKGGLTATFDTESGRAVTLADVLKPGFAAQLSATAITQLEANGASPEEAAAAAPPKVETFARWAVDSESLQVAFMLHTRAVTISFPLASVSSIIERSGALGH